MTIIKKLAVWTVKQGKCNFNVKRQCVVDFSLKFRQSFLMYNKDFNILSLSCYCKSKLQQRRTKTRSVFLKNITWINYIILIIYTMLGETISSLSIAHFCSSHLCALCLSLLTLLKKQFYHFPFVSHIVFEYLKPQHLRVLYTEKYQ